MAKVSIIVPVYNGSEYLNRCINSLRSQTLKDIEIVLVDDGSTDNSGAMCDAFAKEDSRIVSLHKENGGLGSARNYGLKNISSEYVGFVDCDDWVNIDTYEYLYNLAIENHADISSGKFAIVHSEEDKINSLNQSVEIYQGINKQKIYLEIGIRDRSSQYSVCTKIYRKELFDTIQFPEGQLYEDVVTNFKLLDLANKFVLSNKYVYNYYMESISITRNMFSKKDFDLIKVGNQIKLLTEGTEIEELGKIMCARTYFSLLVKAEKYGIDETVSEKKDLIKMLRSHIKDDYKLLIKSELPINRKIVLMMLRYMPDIIHIVFKAFR